MIKLTTILISISLTISALAQDKSEYLQNNKSDLTEAGYTFPQSDFKILGFSALHGSAKTYEAELNIVSALKKQDLLDVYIIEANYSQAHYFQTYLDTGDEKLLKELTLAFETIVSQEGSIETFNFWKKLRGLHLKDPTKPIQVIGCDVINEYRFPIKHLLAITNDDADWNQREMLKQVSELDTANFMLWNQDLSALIKSFTEDYLANKAKYKESIKDLFAFEQIVQNLTLNFQDHREREKIIYDNYLVMKEKFNLTDKKQFAKYGYGHVIKDREGNYPSFFTRLIENDIYDRDQVITVMSYLTNSKVLWDKVYDKENHYKTYTTKAGFGISDYWLEYFQGIKLLKKQKMSDQTIFRLNQKNSPYGKGTDLIEIKMLLKKHNSSTLKGKNTLQFIDYAVLIRDSKEQVPLEEMK